MTTLPDILGRPVKDKITGFSGIATGQTVFLSGCTQVGVTPPVGADGKTGEINWFDEQRLTVDYETAQVVLDNDNAGFDAPPPSRHRDLPRG